MEKKYKVDSQQDHDSIMKIISHRSKPKTILSLLMNSLESYRQSRKLGWSRPWNKYNLINFQSFRLDKETDAELYILANKILNNECTNIPKPALKFVDFLLHECSSLMGFVFIHEYMEDGQLYEGATLSLGCIHKKQYRDRLDIIVEAPVIQGTSQGFNRLRVFIDPFTEEKDPLWTVCIEQKTLPFSNELFSCLSDISNQWHTQLDKHWSHWTSDYIDYFGPRQHQVQNSYFHQHTSDNG